MSRESWRWLRERSQEQDEYEDGNRNLCFLGGDVRVAMLCRDDTMGMR